MKLKEGGMTNFKFIEGGWYDKFIVDGIDWFFPNLFRMILGRPISYFSIN